MADSYTPQELANLIDLSTDAVTDGERCTALIELALALRRTDPERGLRYAKEALAAAERTGVRRLVARGLAILGDYRWRYQGNPDGIEHLELAHALFGKLDDRRSAAEVAVTMASAYANRLDAARALHLFKSAVRAFERLDDKRALAHALKQMAMTYRGMGDNSTAITIHLRAIALCEEIEDDMLLSGCHNDIGLSYRLLEDYDSALRHFFDALAIRIRLGDRMGMAITLNNIGGTFVKRSMGRGFVRETECQRAIPYLLRAQEIYASLGISQREAKVWNILGGAHEMLEEYQEASRCLDRAEELNSSAADPDLAPRILGNRARVRYKQKKYAAALRDLRQAMHQAESLGIRHFLMEAHHLMSEIYDAMGDAASALREFRIYRDIYDELLGPKVWRTVADVEALFEMERQERELARASTQTRKLESDLQRNREELAAATLQLVERGSLLRKLAASNSEASDIKDLIPTNDAPSAEWAQVVKRIDIARGDFYERLSARFGDLTPAELKVASLIHAGLSSKEIGALLYIVPRTVDVHRGNIRRKLGLERSASLFRFLADL